MVVLTKFSINRVSLVGEMTRDVDVRYSVQGKPKGEINILISKEWDEGGETKSAVCYVDVTIWGSYAEDCSKNFKKGDTIHVEGELQYDGWKSPDSSAGKLKVKAREIQLVK